MPQNPFRGQNTAESLGLSASITLAKQLSFDFAKPGVVDISMLCSSVSFKSHTDTETNQTSCSAIMIKRQNLKKKKECFECFCWELQGYFQWEDAYASKKICYALQTGPKKNSRRPLQMPKWDTSVFNQFSFIN